MKATNTITLILIGLILGYLIRMWVHPRLDDKVEMPFETVPVNVAQEETRNFITDSTDPTRAVMITGEFLNALTQLRDSLDSYGLRIYFATDEKSTDYTKFIVVGTNEKGNDLVKLSDAIQKGQLLAQDGDERYSSEASEIKKSAKYNMGVCPDMCDLDSQLMPEDAK